MLLPTTIRFVLRASRPVLLGFAFGAWPAFGVLAQATASAIQPDAGFGTSGSVSVGLPGAGYLASPTGGANTVANYDDMGQLLLATNHIWVCGGGTNTVLRNSSIRRFLPNGTPDVALGTNGTLQAPFAIRGAVVQSDGKLVVAGTQYSAVNYIGLARYDAAGVLDPSFGTGGVVQGSPTGELRRVFVLPGGKLLAVGWLNGAGRTQVYRLLPNGQFDTSFNNGSAMASYSGDLETVGMQPDGRILIVSTENPSSTPGAHGVTVTRLLATGEPDTGFGTAGRASITGRRMNSQGQLSPYQTETLGVAVQPTDGKIVLTGFTFGGSSGQFPALLRMNANGTPDAAFNDAVIGSLPFIAVLNSVVVQPNGDLIVAGSATPVFGSSPQIIVARFSSAGVRDANFGTGVLGNYFQALATNLGTISEMMWQAPGQLLTLGGFDMLNSQPNGLRLARYRVAFPSATHAATVAGLRLQAAPVPASGTVQLSYTLPTASTVHLTLHDALGRSVAGSQVTPNQAAGPQQLSLDLHSLAAGVYTATLEASGLRQTVRLIGAP